MNETASKQVSSGDVSGNLPHNVIGMLFMLMAVLAGLITAAMIKTLAPEMNMLAVLAVRFAFSMPLLILFGLLTRGKQLFQINRKDMLAFRVAIGHIGILFWFLSVANTTLGQATALFQSSAIFVTILAPLVLREKVGIYRGSAVILGLVGIFMITNPFSDTVTTGAIWGLLSALAGAALVVALRMLGKTDVPISVALWHNGIGAVIYPSLLLVLFPYEFVYLTDADKLMLFVIFGLAASLVQSGFAYAYRYGEAIVLVPMRYLSVPASVLIGWLYWNEQPGALELTGMIVVVMSCIFISVREYRLGRASKATEPVVNRG